MYSSTSGQTTVLIAALTNLFILITSNFRRHQFMPAYSRMMHHDNCLDRTAIFCNTVADDQQTHQEMEK